MSDIKYKDPDAVLDYGVDWGIPNSTWLDGDIISASEWIVPSGLNEIDSYFTDTETTIWLSGGVVGICYEVVNRITTAGLGTNQRIDDRTIHIMVQEK